MPFPASPLPFSAALAIFVAPIVWATYCAGSAILLIGLIVAFLQDIPRAHGLDKMICLGPVLFAVPLAIFGAEHLTVTRDLASMVPQWIPGHMFWALFVGFALLAAALSIAVGRVAALASVLLGFMFLCFVLLMDLPAFIATPADRFALALTLRELSFGACAFALASTLTSERWRPAAQRTATAARYTVGAIVVFYGVEHFLHPQFVPVIPLSMQMPPSIPFHPLWAYGVGAVLVAAGVAMLTNWHARAATTVLGTVVCVVVVLFYGPLLAAHPADIGVGMNYFADTLFFGGALLLLAGSISPRLRGRAAVAEPAAKLQNK